LAGPANYEASIGLCRHAHTPNDAFHVRLHGLVPFVVLADWRLRIFPDGRSEMPARRLHEIQKARSPAGGLGLVLGLDGSGGTSWNSRRLEFVDIELR
jgi:hypothetical protein